MSTATFIAATAGIVAAVFTRYFRSAAARAALLVLVVFSFLPIAARTPAEYAAGVLSVLVLAGGVLLLVRLFLRDNPLAWLTSAWLGLGGAAAIGLLAEPSGAYRVAGGMMLAGILVPVAWLLFASRRAES